ncbi:MAG: alpha/beta fold hydrolase [Bacteroidota bacterium]
MELYFREFGAGKPVIILHGLFGFSDNWQTIAKSLASQYLVITPDLRNHGRSPHTPSHTYTELAEDIRLFMENHWMHSAVLIGHSMGGKVAMQMALSYPDMVEKLIVVDIAPGKAADNHTGIFEALLETDLSAMQTRGDIENFLVARIPDVGTRQFLLKNITRNDDGKFAWKMNLPVLWRHFSDILDAVTGEPFDKPALFVRGDRSDYIKEADTSLIKTLFPQAEITTIENAGHWVHADKPNELIAVLSEFLDRN